MENYEQNLHINDDVFEKMRTDADLVLQRLIKNMIEKDSMDGKVTINIDLSLTQEFIPNRDPKVEGETRRVLTPKIAHKVVIDSTALEGRRILALPGASDDGGEEIINNESENEAEGYIEAEVVSDDDLDEKIPFKPEDDYDYEQPDNE